MRPRKKDRDLPKCVYRSHGGYFYVRGGKWLPLGRDLGKALAEYGRLISTPKGGMPELIEEAFPHITKTVAVNTVKQYRLAANKLADVFKEFAPEQVMPRHIAAMKRGLADTPNWCNRVLTVARKVFAYALEEQLIDRNPCIGIERHPEAEREKLVSEDEYARIYAHADARLQVILDLLRLTGQRVTDVLNIRVADLEDEGIRFKQRKTGARLIVQWSPELRKVVARAKTLHGNVRALTLLHNRRGKAPDYSTIKGQFDEARTKAGCLDVEMRDLRAMAATALDAEGKDAQALLGHTSPSMTRRYLRSKQTPIVEGPSFRHLKGGK